MDSIVVDMNNILLYKPRRTEEEKKCPDYLIILKNKDYYEIDEDEVIKEGYWDKNDFYAQNKENEAIGVAIIKDNIIA